MSTLCIYVLSQHHKIIIIIRMGSSVMWEKKEDKALSWAWVAARDDTHNHWDWSESKEVMEWGA